MVALLYVCQIAKEQKTLHTYLKKGWEGTNHHDNTGRNRMYAIKKMEAIFCILVFHPPCRKKPHIFVCMDKIKLAHTNAHTHPHTP